MRTPKRDGAKKRSEPADGARIEKEPNSHPSGGLSGEREVEKPTKLGVSDEVADDDDGRYSLNTLGVDGHDVDSGLTDKS